MSTLSNDPLGGVRTIKSAGFESAMARTSGFSRAMATQDRINRAFTASDRINRVMKAAMPVTTMPRLATVSARTGAIDRAFRVPLPFDVRKAYRPIDIADAYRPIDIADAYRPIDIADAYRPILTADVLRGAVKAQVRPGLVDALSRAAGLNVVETVCASVKAQVALGLRDAGAFSTASIGRRWAEQHRLATFAGLGDMLMKHYGLAGLGQAMRVKQHQDLLDAVRPTLHPITWQLDGIGIHSVRTSAFSTYAESIQRFGESTREIALFIDMWETRALWFLMASVGVGVARVLRDLPADEAEEAEEAVLDALEEAATDSRPAPSPPDFPALRRRR